MIKRKCLQCGKEFKVFPCKTKKFCGNNCYHLSRKNIGIHLMSGTKFYGIWQAIKYRCLNNRCKDYNLYGGRGIKICNRWLKFENFRNDMYKKYINHINKFSKKNTSIDRINNNGHYCKENCRWATNKIQSNNKRSTKFITYNNITMSAKKWEQKLNFNNRVLYNRIFTYKWDIKRAFEQKPKKIH